MRTIYYSHIFHQKQDYSQIFLFFCNLFLLLLGNWDTGNIFPPEPENKTCLRRFFCVILVH